MKNIDIVKQDLIAQIDKRLEDKIIEQTNADLLKKLISQAETTNEAMMIAELGTTYKRTGFHFDKRLEKMGSNIKYLRKNEELSFENDKDTLTHKLIIGDNYDALQQLLITHRGMIDVIYIDPPYGANDMGEFADTNYTNAITRDNLLSMLYPRLQLAKQLMSNEGLIFVSIDDKNQAYVKCLMDEVFEDGIFINIFVWQRNSSAKTEKGKFTVNTEYVLLYAKSNQYTLNDAYKPLSEASMKLFKFDDNDGRGKYQTVSLQKPRDPGPETTYDYVDNNGKVWSCPSKGWRMKKEKIKDLENDNRLVLTGKTLRVKDYWNERENEGKRIDTLWNDLSQNTAGSSELESILSKSKTFENPKPTDLIKRCLQIASKDCWVLDFFAGSGTTGQAVMELNREDSGKRRFILCTNNEITDITPNGIAYDVTSKRLKRVMSGECYDGTNDFKWLTKNVPYRDNLEVYDSCEVYNANQNEGESPFDVIDETCYDLKLFTNMQEKIAWVCSNFENTQKYLGGED